MPTFNKIFLMLARRWERWEGGILLLLFPSRSEAKPAVKRSTHVDRR